MASNSALRARLGIRDDVLLVEAEGWRTPVTGMIRRHGTARLGQTHYRGTYHANGLDEHTYMYLPHWLPVTMLQLKERAGWKTWMVDDPLHWLGMRRLVAHLPAGRIVCAGLGLGLMLHHIVADRPDITDIRVIERNPDVIDLITPTLPPDDRITVVEADFYRYVELRPDVPDGVLWDLAVGGEQDGNADEVRADFLKAQAYVGVFWPSADLKLHGDVRWLNWPEGHKEARRGE